MAEDPALDVLLHRLLKPRIGQTPRTWPRRVYNFVESAARMTGQTPAALLEQLLEGTADELLEALVDSATIGHTAFFRHPAHFERLRALLPELARGRSLPVQVWCAGCSTGEEAFSVLLCAREVGVPVRVLATDVNRRALEHARVGHYVASPRTRLPGAAAEWTAPAELRQCVRFLEASIAAGAVPLDAGPFDLIFCRNVLIYFNRAAVPHLLQGLASRLSNTGTIVVSPADAVLPLPPGLRWGSPAGWLERSDAPALAQPPPQQQRSERVGGPPPSSGTVLSASEAPEPQHAQAQIARASRLRSSGRSEEAEQLLVAVLNRDPSNVVAWYLLGEALLERGEAAQAGLAFRRAKGLSARD